MNNKFSLALGGGWARGLAHIWVIRILESLQMTPVAISGTSMGAIIWALLALWKTSDDMEAIISKINFVSLVDIDLKEGILKGRKIEKLLDHLFESKSFADCQIPLSIVATDINTWERVIFTKGRLSEAVRASLSLPGIFVPKKIGDHELVDGGLTNNLPIELLPPWPVIAVSALRDLTRKIQKSRKIWTFDIKKSIIWNSYSVLQKTIDIMLAQNESRSLTSRKDIISIRPEFDALDYYEFNKYPQFIQAGMRQAEKILAKTGQNLQNQEKEI